jgi:1,2-diacylglycerol 3-beta-galactosyltransferase
MSKGPLAFKRAHYLSPRRFLFLFSDTGGGHRASAQAVKDEMERLYGRSASVEMIDIFVEMNRWPFDRFPDWYRAFVAFNGIPWGVGYHLSDGVRLMTAMSKLIWPYARNALCNVLREHPADALVSFHPIPNYALVLAKRDMGWPHPLSIVTLDLVTVHAGWFTPNADRYLVPTEAARSRARRWGVPQERIVVTGMPTRRSFVTAMAMTKAQARATLGLPPEQPVVLIIGGGDGMGPLAQVVRAIARQRPHARLVVITGRNRALQQELSEMDLPVALHIEGFVSNMEIWMRAADILVTKAGPNTLCEAFITGLPIVLYTALPGQEEGNVTHVVQHGAGIWAPMPWLTAKAVMRLLNAPAERRAMAARSHALAHPKATEDIARQLWSLTPHRRKSALSPILQTDAPPSPFYSATSQTAEGWRKAPDR